MIQKISKIAILLLIGQICLEDTDKQKVEKKPIINLEVYVDNEDYAESSILYISSKFGDNSNSSFKSIDKNAVKLKFKTEAERYIFLYRNQNYLKYETLGIKNTNLSGMKLGSLHPPTIRLPFKEEIISDTNYHFIRHRYYIEDTSNPYAIFKYTVVEDKENDINPLLLLTYRTDNYKVCYFDMNDYFNENNTIYYVKSSNKCKFGEETFPVTEEFIDKYTDMENTCKKLQNAFAIYNKKIGNDNLNNVKDDKNLLKKIGPYLIDICYERQEKYKSTTFDADNIDGKQTLRIIL